MKPDEHSKSYHFAEDVITEMDDNELFLQYVVFSDVVIFHVSRHAHRHSVRI